MTPSWTFARDGESLGIDLEPHVTFGCNEGAIAAAVVGLGITSTTGRSCHHEDEAGSL